MASLTSLPVLLLGSAIVGANPNLVALGVGSGVLVGLADGGAATA